MLGLFKRGSGGGSMKPSLDAIRFDITGYESQGEPHPGKLRVWSTPESDGLGLYFFSQPPDLPGDARTVTDLREFYDNALRSAGTSWSKQAYVERPDVRRCE